jgi:hypothetical protein
VSTGTLASWRTLRIGPPSIKIGNGAPGRGTLSERAA